MRCKYLILILNIVVFGLFNSSFAKENNINYYKKYQNEINIVEQYLNNVKNISAKFSQISSSGAISKGNFYLSRPGKLRIDYDLDQPIIIVVNNSVLTYYDKELEEKSNLRTQTTPASFLTRKKISFSAKDIKVIDAFRKDNFFKITIIKKNSRRFGNFSLLFSLNPVNFIQMEVENDMGDIVNVNLYDVNYDQKLENSLFIIKDSD